MPTAAAKLRSNSEDTEITLGLGKMLALFFGLVMLCAVFFGLGFSFGRTSVQTSMTEMPVQRPVATNTPPKPVSGAPQSKLTFYKDVEKKDADSQLADATTESDTEPSNESAPTPAGVANAATYFVQVAAVSKQEDAQLLVEALKKKQYAAFSTSTPSDKLFHVQIGPFGNVKEAEAMRAKLINDGYNPIVRR